MVERWRFQHIFIPFLFYCARGATNNECTNGVNQWIGDGVCDWQNNRPSCLYDGGDCCACTCVDGPNYSCGADGYRCLDPNVLETLSPSCNDSRSPAIPCLTGHEHRWVVRNTNDAAALAEVLSCSGGSFEVDWVGAVIVEKTISISNGTVLNIRGNSSAVIDGGSTNRLFTVVDAVLHLSEVNVSHGHSVFGGAIAAVGSLLTFNRTIFSGNTAARNGGALFAQGCTLSFNGDTSFFHNSGVNGGAAYMVEGTSALWAGETSFTHNIAGAAGGALYLTDGGSTSWGAKTTFSGNAAGGNGGALYVSNSSSTDLTGRTVFADNSAGWSGGALHVADRSRASWAGNSSFLGNTAVWTGGALSILRGSTTSGRGLNKFAYNTVDGSGGAVHVADGGNASWEGNVTFLGNAAGSNGGALHVSNSSSTDWTGRTVCTDNSAGLSGGALYVADRSMASWTGNSAFSGNAAVWDGGGLSILHGSTASGTGQTTFADNAADASGGAVRVTDGSSAFWEGNSTFSGNAAGSNGGALHVSNRSSIDLTGRTVFTDNSAGLSGGTLHVADRSSASWTGYSAFSGNAAIRDGGALSILHASTASGTGQTTFADNAADGSGGAVRVTDGSSASWKGNSTFSGNAAGGNGGALHVSNRSSTDLTGRTVFTDNSAGVSGGALHVTDRSSASWAGYSAFSGNAAIRDGGALSILHASTASGIGQTTFADNAADGSGGAVRVTNRSGMTWAEETNFSHNAALIEGGALYISGESSLSGSGRTTFSQNTAGAGGGALNVVDGGEVSLEGDTAFAGNFAGTDGGAVRLYFEGIASWNGNTDFDSNTASASGGALFLEAHSNASCIGNITFSRNVALSYGGAQFLLDESSFFSAGKTSFVENVAESSGGALYITDGSSTAWEGWTTFSGNTAKSDDGGAMYVGRGSSAFWESAALFSTNRAGREGGAVFVDDGSDVFWSGETQFFNNTAVTGSGGAVLVAGASTVQWVAETGFTSNVAGSDGGAIASRVLRSGEYSRRSLSTAEESRLIVAGQTMFAENSCGGKGGGLVMLGGLSAAFVALGIIFVGNDAAVAGGGVFISSTGEGPVFTNATFMYNNAQSGGGVYATGSGTSMDTDGELLPTTFEGCMFIGNTAGDTGGGVESTAGNDRFIDTLFKGNIASEGGALRLAGEASLVRCSFEKNAAEVDGGPTVSNIGTLSAMSECSFSGNTFDCETGSFLIEVEVDDPFSFICSGCGDCEACSMDDPQTVPACSSAVDHALSQGGHNVTLEWLQIQPGYWRATNNSLAILPCYKAEACNGGITGSEGFCHTGYSGPYCSVCRENFFAGPGFTCTKCSVSSVWRVMVAGSLSIFAAIAGVVTVSYLVSDESEGAELSIVDRIIRRVPVHSVKIIIVSWQILTQFASLSRVTFPGVYQGFLGAVHLLNFDLTWLILAGCEYGINFYARLLIMTLCPIIAVVLLGATYLVAADKNHGSSRAIRIVGHKHVSMALLITFLVYSSVSSVLFQTFDCEVLDDGNDYLRADYSIECDTFRHRAFMIYAGFMILVYPVGIPALYAVFLFRNRKVLTDENARQSDYGAYWISDLWMPYKPWLFYYEVVECVRRITLAGVVLFFVGDNTSTQISVTLLLAILFALIAGGLTPYDSQLDGWISCMGHAVVILSLFFLLVTDVQVLDEAVISQDAYGWILIALNASMVLVVIRFACCGYGYAKDRTARGFPV